MRQTATFYHSHGTFVSRPSEFRHRVMMW